MLSKKTPCFLQGFDPSTSSQSLKIPSKFVQHIRGGMFGRASITGPSGNTWHANLIQQNDDVFLHDGWEAFVMDHSLEFGDALVFRYDGNLQFTVQVFDETSCEKEDAFSVICSQDLASVDNDVGKKRERETALLDSIVEGVPKKMRSVQALSGSVTKNKETGLEMVDTVDCCTYPLQNSVTIAMPSKSIVCSGSLDANVNNNTDKEDELCSYSKSCTKLLSAFEAQRVARSFTSCFPHFSKVMKRFNICGSYTLNVPYKFSMVHLPNCKVKIVLCNFKGESWTVNSIPTTKVQTSHTFCGGWLAFVRDNNISIGDICIFELVDKCALRVQVVRVGMEGYQCSLAAKKGLTNVELSSRKESDLVELAMTKKNFETTLSDSKYKEGFPSKLSAFSSRPKSCNGKLMMQKKDNSHVKQGSYTKSCMSMKSAPEEKLAAQFFVSEFPHFVRIMKKFNVGGSYTLKIPYQFSIQHLPSCKTEIILHNLNGECWTVNSIPTIKVQTLHTFCGGWMAFVRDNDIQMGDICIFELVDKCEMRVHIASIGRKGLEYRSYNGVSNELHDYSS